MSTVSFYVTIFFGIIGLLIGFLILTRKKKFESKCKYTTENIEFVDEDNKRKKYYTTNPSECVDIRFSKTGVGSSDESPPITVFQLVDKAIANDPHSTMMAKEYKSKNNNAYEWKYWSRQEFYDLILSAARGFIALGLNECESVCIMGFNAPEWHLADLAAIYAGGIACGLYTTNNAGQCEYILNDCNAKIIVLENEKLLNKFLQISNKSNNGTLANVSCIVLWDKNDYHIVDKYKNEYEFEIITWDELIHNYGEQNVEKSNEIMRQRQSKIGAGNCCTLIYTSGTTGAPKGVMLSHDNLTWTIKTILCSQKHISFWGAHCKFKRHSIISYLPLSHIAAQALDIYGPFTIAYFGGDGTIYCARHDALKGSLIKTLTFVQPTVFLGVPRVWQKIEQKMRLIGKKGNFLVKFISLNSKKIGLRGAYNKQLNGNKKIPLLYNLIEKVLFSTIKSKLGFSRLQLAITGAAPIGFSTMQYFHSLGIDLIEGYGMSESTALITMGLSFHNKIGCAGPPLLGVDIRVDEHNQNEICFKGRNVMMGYLHNETQTNLAINHKNDYLRTGDIGRMQTQTNLLYITGRIKELIVTSGGENIAPVPIEGYLKSILTGISNCVLIGDNRKYLTLIITLKTKTETSRELDGDAMDIDINCNNTRQAQQSSIWKEYIQNGLNIYNQNEQQCVSRAQRVQYFAILDQDFCEENGTTTSTLKLKRSVINHKYKQIIDDMYNT